MKKTLEESQQRIFEIIKQMDESFILPELHQSGDKLMKLLRQHIDNLSEVIKAHFNKINGAMVLTGKIDDIHFYITLINGRGEIDGIHIIDKTTNTSGFIKIKAFESQYDDVIEAINDIVYQD